LSAPDPTGHRRAISPRNGGSIFFALTFGALLAAPLAAGPVSAPVIADAVVMIHQRLVASSPAAGEELDRSPERLRLEFAEAVQLPFTQITVTGPTGPVSLAGDLQVEAGAANVLLVELPALQNGTYVVEWRTAGSDGHPVIGSFEFQVAQPEPPATDSAAGGGAEAGPAIAELSSPAPSDTHSGHADDHGTTAFGVSSPGYVVVRWLTFGGTLGLLGAVAFQWLVLGSLRRRRDVESEVVAAAAGTAARIGVIAAALLLIAALARLCAQAWALTGSIGGAPLSAMLFGSVWGLGWWLQVGGAVLGLAAFGMARRNSAGWALAMLAGAAVACAPACSGHAASAPGSTAFAMFVDVAHVLAAGGWIGGLVLLLVAGLPAALRSAGENRTEHVTRFVSTFSNTALFFAALAVVSGLAAMSIHIDAPSDLWGSDYGRTLLAKFAALALLFALGAYNFLRVRPALAANAPANRLRRSGTVEVAAALVVLLITAVLVATPPPASESGPTITATDATTMSAAE